MTEGPESKNESLLRGRFPGLLERIREEASAGAGRYELRLEETIRGEPTLTAAGKWVHSRFDPRREAARLTEGASGDGPVIVLGFGLGYSAEAAASAFPDRPLIIVEKDARILEAAFETRDLSFLLSRDRIVFVAGGDANDVLTALDGHGGEPSLVSNRTLRDLDAAWYDEAENAVRTWASKDEINAATLRRFGSRWVRNLVRNLDSIRDAPGIARLAGRFTGLPALLIAAGPSLDEMLPHLPELSRRCLLVAVDTSLRAALARGVDPDFAVVVDPQYWNARHLDRCAARRTALVAESAVYPSVLSSSFSRMFLCSSLFPLGRFVEDGVDPKGILGAGGSVATTAWDFVRTLGAGPVWVAGLDLSFPELKTHFKGALFEERAHADSMRTNGGELRSFRALRDGFPFYAPSADGSSVLTDKRLSLYASWFESRFLRHPESAPGSLSAAGLRIRGMRTVEMRYLLSLPDRRGEIDDRLARAFADIDADWRAGETERRAAYGRRVAELMEALDELADIADAAALAAESASLSDHPSSALPMLDEAMARIDRSAAKDVAGFLFPRMSDLEAEIPAGLSDPLARYLAVSRRLYEELSSGARFTGSLLKKRFKAP